MDNEFRNQLYDRLANKPGEHLSESEMRMRSGLSPIAKNIINIRYKKKPKFDPAKVAKIETILKDLIDFGFSDHVDE